jgi:hypothetical protein
MIFTPYQIAYKKWFQMFNLAKNFCAPPPTSQNYSHTMKFLFDQG